MTGIFMNRCFRKIIFTAVFLASSVSSVFAAKAESKIITEKLSNGIPVYIKNSGNGDFCSVYMVFKGGVSYLTKETSGLETSVFSMLSKGSKSYTKPELKKFFYETHGSFNYYSINAGSVFGMNCLSRYFDETFARYSEAVLSPVFPQEDYNLLVNDLRQQVQESLTDPSSMLLYYMGMMLYENHPYSAKSSVTQESIENITYDAIVSHYKTLVDSRRISIVASGGFDSSKLLSLLENAFGGIQAGKEPLKSLRIPKLKVEGEPVVLVNQNASGAAQILRAFPSPSISDPDYLTACIAAKIYSDIMYNIVREKNGMCYTPISQVTASEAPFGFEVLCNATALSGFAKALDECRSIMRSGKTISAINPDGSYVLEPIESRLEGYINSFITSRYSSQATVGGVALRLASSLLQYGDVTASDRKNEEVKNITVTDIERVFDIYWVKNPGRWFAVVGPSEEENIQF